MLADFNNGILVLQLDEDLKSFQKSQLNYWGFRKTQKGYEIKLENNGKLLVKIVDYFTKEQISLSLTNNCQELLGKLNVITEEFDNTFSIAKSYKDSDDRSIKKYKIVTSAIKKITKRSLKDHQLKAATHLYLARNGANFSVPGSGKTSVTLSVYEKLRLEGKVNTLFIIGPPSCFRPWRSEFYKTLGRLPKYQILAGGDPSARKSKYFLGNDRKTELYLISFQTLLKDYKDVEIFMRRQGMDIFLVIDEAHYIKKIEGNWASTILGLSKYAKFRCVLTGTPMPRSYVDVYNLFDFLWPDNNPIDAITKIKIQQLERNNGYEEIKEILKNKIGPLFYRVRKSDLKLKPPFFHEPIMIPMNRYEKLIYDLIENRIIEFDKKDYIKNADIVKKLRRGRLIRLRQCASYTKLLITAIDNYQEDLLAQNEDITKIIKNYDTHEVPAKLEYLLKMSKTSNNRNEKIIVWTNFIGTIKLIEKTLKSSNVNCKSIYGEVPIEQQGFKEEETREKIIEKFLDPKSGLNVLIANPAACAESISLHTTCHTAIYYDLSYNCAQYLQSLDRIHRVGGSESVDTHYYFLQYPNTIDADISQNLTDKASRMNALIEEDYNIYNLDMFEDDDDEEAYRRVFEKEKK